MLRMRRLVPCAVVLTAVTIGAAGSLLVPAAGSPIRVLTATGNVVIGDVNSDGRADLVATSSADRRVAVLLGQGDGRFAPAPDGVLDVPESPHEIALGDLNADGHLDIALASHESYNVILLFGNGRAGFRPASSPVAMKDGRQPHTHGLGITDFNGDRHADLITVNSNDDNDVAVALGDGRGGFMRSAGSPFQVGPAPYPMALGDLDSDGRMDVVVTSTGLGAASTSGGSPADALTLLLGDGRGGFTRRRIPMRTGRTWFVAIGDLNGDGKRDLVTTHTEDRRLSVLLGDGRGSFAEVGTSPVDLGQKAWYVALADLNQDRNADVVAAAETGLRVLIGDGRGGFTPAAGSPFATGKGTWRLVVGDVNRDGRSDVAASNLESASVSVFLGR